MYSLVSLLSGICPLPAMHSLLVTLYLAEYLVGINENFNLLYILGIIDETIKTPITESASKVNNYHKKQLALIKLMSTNSEHIPKSRNSTAKKKNSTAK